jgi:L-alanine-DL-glutamate epimerase-like enolase superfamily enzyme
MAYVGMISRDVVGRPAGDVEAMIGEIMAHGRWVHTYRFTNAVLGGIEAACWDAWGKALSLPAFTFFGGGVRSHVDFSVSRMGTRLLSSRRGRASSGSRATESSTSRLAGRIWTRTSTP